MHQPGLQVDIQYTCITHNFLLASSLDASYSLDSGWLFVDWFLHHKLLISTNSQTIYAKSNLGQSYDLGPNHGQHHCYLLIDSTGCISVRLQATCQYQYCPFAISVSRSLLSKCPWRPASTVRASLGPSEYASWLERVASTGNRTAESSSNV